ncbi:thiamine pyrophosphate-dependent enzyme [Serratia grimesii]|uniref:thiamine pyrophosphate-dependent enzyme n=1 Tax=Serratia grimesii TaxID=82995 RepID=UPI00217BD4F3|nr:thiamine pyrophosphate-dependent enzyme [Serratia grimesii]CAI0942914.1 Acetolactate synthase isozyme 1 large subunit [Serratia grimesii]
MMGNTATTGQTMVRSLIAHGIDTVFGIPGAHMYDFNDALYQQREQIRFIHTRHEQGAGYMAYGYAKSTGRIGAYTVVPGPGVLNSGAALCTAYGGNTPVLCLTGNIMSHLIGQGRGQLHELPDQLNTLSGITKVARRVNHVTEAAPEMAEVIGHMLSGRQGPGAIEAPWDVFGMQGVETELPLANLRPAPAINPAAIEAAASLIAQAKNPLIMVGGGAVAAGDAVAELARRLQAPVTSHRSGKGVVPDDSPYALNFVAGFDYWQQTDLLIGIGSRLELQFMRWRWLPKNLKVIRIDIDPTEMVRLKPDVAVVADAQQGVEALLAALPPVQPVDRRAALSRLNQQARERFSCVQPQVDYLNAIRAALPRDGFFVEEVSQVGFTARFAFPVYEPRHYVTCGYQDNLGFGYNTALGVKVAHPDKVVISVSGDGGFMFGVQELATAVQHGINVIAIVFNNGAYGNVLRDQRDSYLGHYLGSELTNPDFVRLAESFGALAYRATTPDELRVRLAEAMNAERPVVIEVPVERGSEASPWPFIHPQAPQ